MATPPLKSFQRPWSMKNTLLTLKLVISGACMSDQWKSFLFLVCCSQVKYYWSFFSTDPIKEAPATIHDAWKFCKDHSRSVEVFYKNTEGDKILTRVHFQFDPEVSTVCVFAYLYVLYIYMYVCSYSGGLRQASFVDKHCSDYLPLKVYDVFCRQEVHYLFIFCILLLYCGWWCRQTNWFPWKCPTLL